MEIIEMSDAVLITLLICATIIILAVLGTINNKDKQEVLYVSNLKKLTSEEARINGSKGGKKSVEVRRQKKLLKELLEEALEEETKTGNVAVDITTALVKRAKDGNIKAYEVIRDTLGQKPVESVKIENPQATKVLESINKQLKKK